MSIQEISQIPLRIAIAGASGRMGQMLIEAIFHTPNCQLIAAIDTPHSNMLGQDAHVKLGLPLSGVCVSSNAEHALQQNIDVLIDFTRPEGTLYHLELCEKWGVKATIGTTGFDAVQKQRIAKIAQRIAIVLSPNMSVGVNVTFKLLEMAAKALHTGYDVEIIEAHHKYKIDSPSGTALKMGEVIAKTMGRDLNDCAVYERHGVIGERDPKSIGFATIRGGDTIGDHTVLFAGTGERIEISHKASSRQSYAQGSLLAAAFLMQHPIGLFDMFDVLNLNHN